MTLAVPTVHLNGTSKNGLLEQITEALTALHEAERKLIATAPHGRDYYVQPGDAYAKAEAEHIERVLALRNVISELEHIGVKVLEQ